MLEDVIKEVSSCTLPEEDKALYVSSFARPTANEVKAQTGNERKPGTVRYI